MGKKLERLNVRVSSHLKNEIERLSEETGRKESEVVRDLLQMSLILFVHSDKVSLQKVLWEALPKIAGTELENLLKRLDIEEEEIPS